jgi:tRNA A37 threonylcarbamoyladenosine dehydratase
MTKLPSFFVSIFLFHNLKQWNRKSHLIPKIKSMEDQNLGCRIASNSSNEEVFEEVDSLMRFKNLVRLYSDDDSAKLMMKKLSNSHCLIVGLGGVGSWVCEALARSGIGMFTLVDMDDVCISNTNRQLPALSSTIGKFKAEIIRERILDINPEAVVHVKIDFIRPENVHHYIKSASNIDCVIDAADGVADKCVRVIVGW